MLIINDWLEIQGRREARHCGVHTGSSIFVPTAKRRVAKDKTASHNIMGNKMFTFKGHYRDNYIGNIAVREKIWKAARLNNNYGTLCFLTVKHNMRSRR